jgi:glutaredoxin 3
MSKNIMWTTNYCPFCDKAKRLLDKAGIGYETRLVDGEFWTLENLLSYIPGAKTYPQIMLGDNYVGGCDDLEYFLLRNPHGL